MGKLTLTGILVTAIGLGMIGWGYNNENSRQYLMDSIYAKQYAQIREETFAKAQGKEIKKKQEKKGEISPEENYEAMRDLKIIGGGILVTLFGGLVIFAGVKGSTYTGIYFGYRRKNEDEEKRLSAREKN